MWTYVAIAIGGTLGCWARYAQTNLVQAVFGRDFPLATLSINVIGSFLMGFLFILTLERLMIPPNVRVGVLTGVLGGYTTFFDFRDGDAPPCRERGAVQGCALRGSVGRHRVRGCVRRRLSRSKLVSGAAHGE